MSGGYQRFQEEINVNQQDNQQIEEVQAGIFKLRCQGPDGQVFDPDVYPGDWSQADIHKAAWEVGKDDPNGQGVCPCCARQVGHLPLSINCNIRDLAFLGSGMPLYFQFIKSVMMIVFIIFVTSGDYNIITNWYFGINCIEDEDCPDDWTNKASLANKRNEERALEIQQIMNLVCIFVIILILQQIRSQQREIVQHCDDSNYYASDYTIMIKNVKLNQNLSDQENQKQLIELFRSKLEKDPNSLDQVTKAYEKNRKRICGKNRQYKPLRRVLSVNFIYNLEDLNKIAAEKNALLQKRKSILEQLYKQYEAGSPEIHQDTDLNANEEAIKNKDKEYDQFISSGKAIFLGTAFVKFQWECDRNYFLTKENSKQTFNDQVLIVSEPPEPSDVFWENQHITTRSKIFRRILGYLISIFVILVCATLVYFLSSLQAALNQTLKEETAIEQVENVFTSNKSSLSAQKNMIKIISQIASILVTVINFVLSAVITKVCIFEGYSTQTRFNISLARKSSVAQFLNTAVVTFLISVFVTQNIFGAGGLVNNITSIFISNAWIPILTDIIDVGGTIKFIQIYWQKRKGIKNTFSQGELNLFNEKPAYQISDRYAQILKNLYFVAFYAPIVPISLVITIVWLIMFYCVEKINILKRRTIKYSYGAELSTEMIEMLEYILPIYCGANLYWQYEFTGQVSVYAIIGLVIGIFNALLPMEYINAAVFPAQEGITITLPLSDVEDKFLTDFERENPATQDIARQKYTERSIKREQKKKQNQQNQLQNPKDNQSEIEQHSHQA